MIKLYVTIKTGEHIPTVFALSISYSKDVKCKKKIFLTE